MSDLPPPLVQERSDSHSASVEISSKTSNALRYWVIPIVIFGILLPAGVLIFELVAGICAEAVFDPLPSLLHIILVALLPIANLWLLLSLAGSHPQRLRWLAWANGLAIGVGIFYSVLFAPLTPIGIIGLVYFGIGLVLLAPILSLLSALCLRFYLGKQAEKQCQPIRVWPGMLLALLLLLGSALPATVTRIGLDMASSSERESHLNGIRLLRAVGSEKILRQHCHAQTRISGDLIGALTIWRSQVRLQNNPVQAEATYYLVTGKSCSSQPDVSAKTRHSWRRFGNFDFSQGGDRVGGQLKGLSLSASRLDGSFDADAAVAYLEWTMVFQNETALQREARAQIALPPGAVVSRLTLWIDGEEREAAFAGRGEVRAAYEKVVKQRRDPVLVTTAGQDRILMQLFPVPPNGEMKVRVGMTIPATLPNRKTSTFRLPYFHERNFAIPADLKHGIWVESKAALSSPTSPSLAVKDAYALRTEWADDKLSSAETLISAPRRDDEAAWAWDSKEKGFMIRQVFRDQLANRPRHLYVVVDASASMRQLVPRLADSLKNLPGDMKVTLLVADALATGVEPKLLKDAELLAPQLRWIDYAGGNDNLPALQRAMQLAEAQEDSAILWLHGPQAANSGSAEALLQIAERRGKTPPWFDLQVVPGENRIAAALDGRIESQSLQIEDLERLVGDWRSQRKVLVRTLERLPVKTGEFHFLREKTSDHLTRLWAREEIQRLMQKPARRDAAIQLAHRYQLVTPVSGAVVLETRQQYEEAGLEPARSGSVPTIPEPETWVLIGIVLAVLAWRYRQHSNRGCNNALA